MNTLVCLVTLLDGQMGRKNKIDELICLFVDGMDEADGHSHYIQVANFGQRGIGTQARNNWPMEY